jgi:hypothetical protein
MELSERIERIKRRLSEFAGNLEQMAQLSREGGEDIRGFVDTVTDDEVLTALAASDGADGKNPLLSSLFRLQRELENYASVVRSARMRLAKSIHQLRSRET